MQRPPAVPSTNPPRTSSPRSPLRYATVSVDDADTWQAGHEAYADAMAEVAAAYPQDLDVLALTADAAVNVTAWALWDPLTGEPAPGSRAREAERLLDAALALPGGDRHPFVLHLHIHLLEMSERPEAALSSADGLRGLVPDAGHLQHMPSHLDVLCGDYHSSIAANRRAVQADRLFVDRSGPLNFYSLYRAHDLHFIVYSAMFLGRYRDATDAADELSAQLTPELLRIESPPMADWLEAFVPLRTHVLVRFGRWDDLVAQPLPEDRALYCTTTAMVLYGRGVAQAALGDVDAAEATREEFARAVTQVPDTRYLFNNTALDILAVAGAMLDGEIAYRRGLVDEGFTHLRRAIALDDALPVRRTVGLDAADPARLRRPAAGAGPGRGGSGGVCGGPRSRPDGQPLGPPPGQRVEPARLPRVPRAAGASRRGPDHRSAARHRARSRRRAGPGLLRLPARGLRVASDGPGCGPDCHCDH